jgi:hypothetical protein
MDSLNPYAAPPLERLVEHQPRPMLTFTDVLRTGLSLYTTNFFPVVTVTFVVWIPLELLQSYMEHFVLDDDWDAFRLSMLLDTLVGIIAAGSVIAIGAAAMKGERLPWWEALRQGFEAWPRMFWTRIVVGILLVLAFFAFILPFIYVGTRLALAESIAVIEGRSGMNAMRRSFELTTGAFWRYLGLTLITVVPVIVLGMVFQIPLALFPEINHWLLSAAISLILDLCMPWMALTFVAAYWASAHPAVQNRREAQT